MSNSINQVNPNNELTEVSKQCIREMRHFKRCKDHKGQIACLDNVNGKRNMSGPDIVHSNTIVCMNDRMTNLGQTKEQLDILSYLYPCHIATNDNMRPRDCRIEKGVRLKGSLESSRKMSELKDKGLRQLLLLRLLQQLDLLL